MAMADVFPNVQGEVNTPLSIGATDEIPPGSEARRLMFIVSDGGAIVSTANPQVAAGVRMGQELWVQGTSDTDYITLINGNGLALNGNCDLVDRQTLRLFWDGIVWVEISRN